MASVILSKPRRVLIVGGGPCGLVSLRNLVDRGEFDEVVLAERRDDVGGVWYLEDLPTSNTPRSRPFWPSPAYPGLIGNVLRSTCPFHTIHSLLAETHAYLRQFAERFLASGQIRLSTEVVWVDELPESRGWSVTTRDWRAGKDGAVHVEAWDAVVVATSWYDHPSWPESTPGLAEARAAGLATHTQTWNGPDGYQGKVSNPKLLARSCGRSANDVLSQLAPVAQAPVYRSIRRQGLRRFAFLSDSRAIDVLPITRYTVKPTGKLDLQLLDGSTLMDVDAVIHGTGYSAAAAPFVRVLQPPSASSTTPRALTTLTSAHTSPPRIPALYRHILYAPTPTLAVIGAAMSYTPFTLADVASTWLTLFFAGRLAIPDGVEARLQGERERIAKVQHVRQMGIEREGKEASSLVAYHILGPDEQSYAQGLKDDVVAVANEYASVLPEWSDAEWQRREGMYERKWVSLMAARDAELEAQKGVGSIPRL
ncbi:hypothetical protein B0H10DRAFT_2327165 [Mycena sp. CBHHK59/15]|nr:hypothetical protein B0H10DRAFT_2327165 [Mycena sp. CBHHK59/15]